MLSQTSLLRLQLICSFFMIFKAQFHVMRRYAYVSRPKADNLVDVFGKEARN